MVPVRRQLKNSLRPCCSFSFVVDEITHLVDHNLFVIAYVGGYNRHGGRHVLDEFEAAFSLCKGVIGQWHNADVCLGYFLFGFLTGPRDINNIQI